MQNLVRRPDAERPDVQTLSSGFDQVDLAVIYDEDGELQRSLDEKYGVGVVVVTSLLRPVPDDLSTRPSAGPTLGPARASC